jgi:hypothetical protein
MQQGMRTVAAMVAGLVLLAACGGARQDAPGAGPADAETSALRAALAVETPGRAELAVVDRLEEELGPGLTSRLAALVRDPDEAPVVRYNAVLLLGERNPFDYLGTIRIALGAPDMRIRSTAAVALRAVLEVEPERALPLLERALQDSHPNVRGKALETLADYDAGVLRQYVERETQPELRTIGEALIRVAEQRGAPWAAGEDGTLSRATDGGVRLVFRPERRWPTWDAAVGVLTVERPGAAPLRVADGVEAVGGVVPAFVSPDEAHLIYEAGRTIQVLTLATGDTRTVAPGVAPRPLPFSSDFVFLRPAPVQGDGAAAAALRYDVFLAGPAHAELRLLGDLTARPRMDVRGNYSPVRWMRVREARGDFYLVGEDVDVFELPDPFAAAAAGTGAGG